VGYLGLLLGSLSFRVGEDIVIMAFSVFVFESALAIKLAYECGSLNDDKEN